MHNESIDLLNVCKSGLKLIYEEYDEAENNFDVYKILPNQKYQKARKIIINLSKEMPEDKIPEIIKVCRDVDEAIYYLINNMMYLEKPHIEIDAFISSLFNKYMDYLEGKNLEVCFIEVETDIPMELTYEHILEDVKKCDDRMNREDYSGAITSAKTLVEGVCKEILFKIEDKEADKSLNLPALFKKVRNNLNLDTKNPTLEKPLKQVISGFINIVDGLAEIRNSNGDSHARKYIVNYHHALLVVNSAKTVVTFLFDTYEYQRETQKEKV